jgi:NAD(P)H-dependent FMN reductase
MVNTFPETNIAVSVIVGSTRPNRFADKPAHWILEHLQQRPEVTANLLDLKDYQLPWFEETVSPAMLGDAIFEDEAVQRWTRDIGASDAFIIVSPEYNHGYSAVLKNALDFVYREWNRKPVGFVGYGAVSGARVVEQLRQVAVELQMAPIQKAVHLPLPSLVAHIYGGDVPAELAAEDTKANEMIDELLWWTGALKAARLATAELSVR